MVDVSDDECKTSEDEPEKRGRGQPLTTGEHVGKKKKQEEEAARRAEAE